jgi:hypothetical protein
MIAKSSQIGQFNLHRARKRLATSDVPITRDYRVGSLSEYSSRAERDQPTREMQEAEIVVRFLSGALSELLAGNEGQRPLPRGVLLRAVSASPAP